MKVLARLLRFRNDKAYNEGCTEYTKRMSHASAMLVALMALNNFSADRGDSIDSHLLATFIDKLPDSELFACSNPGEHRAFSFVSRVWASDILCPFVTLSAIGCIRPRGSFA